MIVDITAEKMRKLHEEVGARNVAKVMACLLDLPSGVMMTDKEYAEIEQAADLTEYLNRGDR